MILFSVFISDDRWLLIKDRLFRLWHVHICSNQTGLPCRRDLSQAHVPGLAWGMVLAQSMATVAAVVAVFGLELFTTSQVCEDLTVQGGQGFRPLLLHFHPFLPGLLSVVILWVMLIGLSLTFWSDFMASFLFFLNTIRAPTSTSITRINNITHPWGQPMTF